jgi:hypothetical protein
VYKKYINIILTSPVNVLYRYNLTAGLDDSTTSPFDEILNGDTLGFSKAHEIGDPEIV